MYINFNEIIINNENEKNLVRYISKVNNDTIKKSEFIIEKNIGININDYFINIDYIDIELMIFIGLLEVLSGQNICKRYSKAFKALMIKQFDNELIRNKIMKDICTKFGVSLKFLNGILIQFYYYAEHFKSLSNMDKAKKYHQSNRDNDHLNSKELNNNSYYEDNKNLYNKDLYHNHQGMTKKQRKAYIPIVIMSITIVILLSITVLKSNIFYKSTLNQNSHSILEVKGLTLKYILVSVAEEMYDANIFINQDQSLFYKYYGEEAYNHYIWIKDTYKLMPENMKGHLKTLYENASNEGYFLYILADLEDEAGVNQIVYRINRSVFLSKEVKNAAEAFYPYFYEEHLKEYIRLNRLTYDRYASEMNKKLQSEKADILGYIEESSGIKYDNKYKPIIYYTMRPGNALGFIYEDTYISLIPGTEHNYESLFYIPYHEFSHGIFHKISCTKEYKEVAKTLKTDKKMYDSWNNGFYNVYYTWDEWCEESLVEGFAMYLEHKAKGELSDSITSSRPYDKAFFEYLVDINFDPNTMDLKDVSIRFLKSISE